MNKLLLICGLLLGISNLQAQQQLLLKTDFNGKITKGSIEAVIEAVQEGAKIRVGWQHDIDYDNVPDLEHWVNAEFLSVLKGHVFNQVTPIYRQVPNFDLPQINIVASDMMWTAVVGTNGKLVNRYILPNIEKIEDEAMRKRAENLVKVNVDVVATIWIKVE
ncbi:MAG: hypothetical protein AAFO07_09395 [Bacteroidota bacterium]